METQQSVQNTPEINKLVNESFSKELFPTSFRSYDINPEMMDGLTFSDQDFIDLARSVYITNDQRASLKKKINLITGSNLVEEKSYQEYK